MTTQSDTYITSALTQLGLSGNEAKAYKFCLGHGESKIKDISTFTDIPRTTLYGILEELIKKGLIHFIQKGAHRIYSADNPSKLKTHLDKSREILERKTAFLESIFPTLMMQYSQVSQKPIVSYYQGQKEIRLLFEDLLESDVKEALFIGETVTIEDALGAAYLKNHVKRRIQKGMWARGVRTENTEINEPLYESSSKNLRRIRIAPSGFQSPVYVLVYGNKVFFVSSFNESYGVLVESKDLAITMRSWFEVLWKQSHGKTYSKN